MIENDLCAIVQQLVVQIIVRIIANEFKKRRKRRLSTRSQTFLVSALSNIWSISVMQSTVHRSFWTH